MARSEADEIRAAEIGSRLRALREELLISQTAFAIKAGIGRERLASYESGRVALPWSVAHTISSVFNVGMVWLATGKDEKWGGPKTVDAIFLSEFGGRPLLSEVIDECFPENLSELSPRIKKALEKTSVARKKQLKQWPLGRPPKPTPRPSGPFLSTTQSKALEALAERLRDLYAVTPHHGLEGVTAALTKCADALQRGFTGAA